MRVFLFLFFLSLHHAAEAGSLEVIIDGYIQAQGGEEAIKKVKALKISGTINNEGKELTFVQIKKVPNLMRMTLDLPQGELITGYDGKVAWTKSRQMEHSILLNATDTAALAASATLFSPLYNKRDQLSDLLLLGESVVRGDPCYDIEVRVKGSDSTIISISQSTFLERKMERVYTLEGKTTREEHYYEGQLRVPPLTIPRTIESYEDGVLTGAITIESAKLNPGVFSSYFSPPGGLVKGSSRENEKEP